MDEGHGFTVALFVRRVSLPPGLDLSGAAVLWRREVSAVDASPMSREIHRGRGQTIRVADGEVTATLTLPLADATSLYRVTARAFTWRRPGQLPGTMFSRA